MVAINGKTAAEYCANFIHKEIQPPAPRQEWVEIPLADGAINAAKYLSDFVFYQTRQIVIGFELRGPRGTWPLTWSKLLRDFHGQEVEVVFSDDAAFYWNGTATVGPLVDNGATAGVTITVNAQPFKRTFETVKALDGLSVSGTVIASVNVPYMRAFPVFETDAEGITVTYQNETWTLPEGESTAYGMTLMEGENNFVFYGSGTVSMTYRGGAL